MTFATRTTVTGIRISGGAVTGVLSDRGAAATSMLINAARFVPRAWDWESAREHAQRRYEDYYSLPGATKPARGES